MTARQFRKLLRIGKTFGKVPGHVRKGFEPVAGNRAQRDFLSRHGCDCYQGYLFCKPLPIDELEVFMSKLPLVPPGNPLDRNNGRGTWPAIV